jgi:hypothetical protein
MAYEGSECWFHVDMTHGSYNSMKSACAIRHNTKTPGAALSVAENLAGTEALVKVSGAAGWTPGWLNAPFVIRVFTLVDHSEAKTLVRGVDWRERSRD